MKVTLQTEHIETLVEVPSLPQKGDFISHAPSGICGNVLRLAFWWNEYGTLHINVIIKR